MLGVNCHCRYFACNLLWESIVSVVRTQCEEYILKTCCPWTALLIPSHSCFLCLSQIIFLYEYLSVWWGEPLWILQRAESLSTLLTKGVVFQPISWLSVCGSEYFFVGSSAAWWIRFRNLAVGLRDTDEKVCLKTSHLWMCVRTGHPNAVQAIARKPRLEATSVLLQMVLKENAGWHFYSNFSWWSSKICLPMLSC